MKAEDLVIGNKYVPFRKTVPAYSTGELSDSVIWKRAKGWLYYVGTGELAGTTYHTFSDSENSPVGDFFDPSDVAPYDEKRKFSGQESAVITGDSNGHGVPIGTKVTVIKYLRTLAYCELYQVAGPGGEHHIRHQDLEKSSEFEFSPDQDGFFRIVTDVYFSSDPVSVGVRTVPERYSGRCLVVGNGYTMSVVGKTANGNDILAFSRK